MSPAHTQLTLAGVTVTPDGDLRIVQRDDGFFVVVGLELCIAVGSLGEATALIETLRAVVERAERP